MPCETTPEQQRCHAPNSGHTGYFPSSEAEGREHSDEPGDYKNVLFHIQLIRSSVSSPAAPLVCVGLRTWFFAFANNNTIKAPSAFNKNNNNGDKSKSHH